MLLELIIGHRREHVVPKLERVLLAIPLVDLKVSFMELLEPERILLPGPETEKFLGHVVVESLCQIKQRSGVRGGDGWRLADTAKTEQGYAFADET